MARLHFSDVCPGGAQVHVKDTHLRGRYRTSAHTHDFHEFFLVRSGELVHHANSHAETLGAGTLCLVRPDDEHCYQVGAAGDDAVFTNVAVPSSIVPQVAGVLSLQPLHIGGSAPPVVPVVPGWFVDKLDTIRQELDAGDLPVVSQRLRAELLTADVLGLLARHAQGRQQEGGPDAPPWLRRALRELQRPEHYTVGLHRFIDLCGRSQEYVTRTTRRYLGQTPTELVNTCRLREAARLLRDTDEQVLTVVLQVGFNNVSHFLSRFRAAYDCTPRQYRRRHRAVIDPVPRRGGSV